MFQGWIQAVVVSLKELWMEGVGVLGDVIGALIVLIVGLIVASALAAVVERLIRIVKLDNILQKLGVEEYVEKAGLKLESARFLGRIVYWFIVIAFILAVSDILGFQTLSAYIKEEILPFIPRALVAALIVLTSLIAGRFLKNLVVASIKGAGLHAPAFLGALTWWAIVILGFFTALSQLGVAVHIVNSLITGLIAMLAIAGGIAFGLGGRSTAEEILEKLREHVKEE